jgi:hypothetical protein
MKHDRRGVQAELLKNNEALFAVVPPAVFCIHDDNSQYCCQVYATEQGKRHSGAKVMNTPFTLIGMPWRVGRLASPYMQHYW